MRLKTLYFVVLRVPLNTLSDWFYTNLRFFLVI